MNSVMTELCEKKEFKNELIQAGIMHEVEIMCA